MAVQSIKSEVATRGARMLRTALGPAIAAWREDPVVVEVNFSLRNSFRFDSFQTPSKQRTYPAVLLSAAIKSVLFLSQNFNALIGLVRGQWRKQSTDFPQTF